MKDNRYNIITWNFDLLDTDTSVLAKWTYYCYSQFHQTWDLIPIAKRKTLAKVSASPADRTHTVWKDLRNPETLYTYLPLLHHMFKGRQEIDIDVLVDEILSLNQYSVPLTMPGNIAYASACIIRYLWEDPRIVRNFLELKEWFPDEDIGRLLILAHCNSLLNGLEIHSGHSLLEYMYARDGRPRKDFEWVSVFSEKNELPAKTTGTMANRLNGLTVKWFDDLGMSKGYHKGEAARQAFAAEILCAA